MAETLLVVVLAVVVLTLYCCCWVLSVNWKWEGGTILSESEYWEDLVQLMILLELTSCSARPSCSCWSAEDWRGQIWCRSYWSANRSEGRENLLIEYFQIPKHFWYSRVRSVHWSEDGGELTNLFITHLELWLRQLWIVKSFLSIAVPSYLESSLAVVLNWLTAHSAPVSAGVFLTVSHPVRNMWGIESTWRKNYIQSVELFYHLWIRLPGTTTLTLSKPSLGWSSFLNLFLNLKSCFDFS